MMWMDQDALALSFPTLVLVLLGGGNVHITILFTLLAL